MKNENAVALGRLGGATNSRGQKAARSANLKRARESRWKRIEYSKKRKAP